MRALYYNCNFGISGFMNVSAMLDLGMPLDYLLEELSKLNLSGYRLEASKVNANGLVGTQLSLILEDVAEEELKEEISQEKNGLERRRESPEFLESLKAKKRKLFNFQNRYYMRTHYSAMRKHVEISLSKRAKKHRSSENVQEKFLQGGVSYTEILEIIAKSFISEKSKAVSIDIFKRLCEVEFKVQAKEDIVFEQEAMISFLVEIVASAIALDYFKVDKVYATSLNIGSGFVDRSKGKYPISVSATKLLLKELPCSLSGFKLEGTNAVGVGILLSTVDGFNEEVSANILGEGLGFGNDTSGRYSLGVSLLDLGEGVVSSYKKGEIVELCANVDEMSEANFEALRQKLLAVGALDIWQENIFRGAKVASKLCLVFKVESENKILEALKIANIRELRRDLKTRYIG